MMDKLLRALPHELDGLAQRADQYTDHFRGITKMIGTGKSGQLR